jgi:hypothetical protein
MGCLRGLVSIVAIVFVIGIIGAVVGSRTDGGPKSVATSTPAAPVATIDKSAAMQADRKKLIEKLIGEGVFQKVEVPGTLPRLWVRPRFYAAEFDQKQSFVSVVYAYYFDGSNVTDSVRIFDSRSGKEVGSYSAVQGGLKLNESRR